MIRILIAVQLFALGGPALAQQNSGSPFVAVYVDAATEAKLGPFPYDRKIYAQAIDKLKKYKARAVVVKYFLDQAKTEEGDAALARSLKGIPVFLQACIDDSEAAPNPLPEKFALAGLEGEYAGTLSGNSGWLPLSRFSEAAAGLGFVDVRSADAPLKVPFVEKYKGQVVPSLYLSVIQFALGKEARLTGSKSAVIGTRTLPLDELNEVNVSLPASGQMEEISMADLLEGRVPARLLRGKIAVLAYDGDKMHSFSTPIGVLKAHRLFCLTLLELYNMLKP